MSPRISQSLVVDAEEMSEFICRFVNAVSRVITRWGDLLDRASRVLQGLAHLSQIPDDEAMMDGSSSVRSFNTTSTSTGTSSLVRVIVDVRTNVRLHAECSRGLLHALDDARDYVSFAEKLFDLDR